MKDELAGQPMERILNGQIADSRALSQFLWRSVKTGKVDHFVASRIASFQRRMKVVDPRA